MARILTLSDDGVASGFGRIAMEVNSAAARRGHQVLAASLQYDGLLPSGYEGRALPYHVASLAGHNWPEEFVKIASAFTPDVIWVTQDAPYASTVRQMTLDWSTIVFMVTTPVDGAPVFPEWVNTMKLADAGLTISEFGVEAYRRAGVRVGLCRPGVDTTVFHRMDNAQRAALREKAGIASGAFVVGTMAMNQGRKDIPDMLRAFFDFAMDKPDARYVLDMDSVSPAGWHIPALCQQFGWDAGKLLYRAELVQRGVTSLAERYNLLDAHMVISHREGFGLPLVEAMACGAVSIALDWCSGTEIVGEGRGMLIEPQEYTTVSTWGGALDKFPKMDCLISALHHLHDDESARRHMAEKGMTWAKEQRWSAAAENALMALETALEQRGGGV